MRSNIARTCSSGRVPVPGPAIDPSLMPVRPLLERAEEVDQLVELLRVLLAKLRVGGHGRGGVDQRPGDRLTWQPRADLGELGTGPGVAVVADLVAAEAAGGGGHGLA